MNEDKKSRFSIFKRKNPPSKKGSSTSASNNSLHNGHPNVKSTTPSTKTRRSLNQQTVSVDVKLKQCSDAFKQYNDNKSIMEDFVAKNNDVSEAEKNLSKSLIAFGNSIHPPDNRTFALKTCAGHLGQTMHNLSVMRSKMDDRILNDFCKKLTDLETDDNIKEAKANNVLHEELEYQLAKRNNEYYASLHTLTEIYATYFETALTTMRNLQIKLQDLPKANQIPKTLRENYESKNVNKVFGVHLDVILQRWQEPGPIPVALEDMITYLERNCIKNEGLMRVPGHAKEQEQIRDLLNSGKRVDYVRMEITNKAHTVCGMIKMFTRELPEPLIPYDMFDPFLEATKQENHVQLFKELIKDIPNSSRLCLARIVQFLRKIVDHEQYTKMTASNLAISFGMNIMRMRPEEEDAIKLAQHTKTINKVLEILISNSNDFFPQMVMINTMRGTVNLQELGLAKWLQKEIAMAELQQHNPMDITVDAPSSDHYMQQDGNNEDAMTEEMTNESHEAVTSSTAVTPREHRDFGGDLKQRTSDLSDTLASPRAIVKRDSDLSSPSSANGHVDLSGVEFTSVNDHKTTTNTTTTTTTATVTTTVDIDQKSDTVESSANVTSKAAPNTTGSLPPQTPPRSTRGTDDTAETADSAKGWQKVLDVNTNCYYFYNAITQQSQWEDPFINHQSA